MKDLYSTTTVRSTPSSSSCFVPTYRVTRILTPYPYGIHTVSIRYDRKYEGPYHAVRYGMIRYRYNIDCCYVASLFLFARLPHNGQTQHTLCSPVIIKGTRKSLIEGQQATSMARQCVIYPQMRIHSSLPIPGRNASLKSCQSIPSTIQAPFSFCSCQPVIARSLLSFAPRN